MANSRRERLKELKRKLQTEVLNKPETLLELKEINEKLSQVFATKDVKEILIDKGFVEVFEEIKAILQKIDKKAEKPQKVKMPPFPSMPKPLKKVEADVDWHRMPKQRIDWERMPKQEKLKFPPVQKVHVGNFPDEIANKFLIERDEGDRPKRIVEEFDDFTLETTLVQDGKEIRGETIKR